MTDSPNRNSKRSLLVLFSVIVIDLVGFGIVVPILPYYAKSLDTSPTTLGFLLAVYPAFQFIFSPIWGRLSDRIGRKPVMLATILGTAGALTLLGVSHSLLGLFAGRILGGIFGANISVATAYVADVTREDERTRWMGMVGASFGVGFLIGPAIGGVLAPFGYGVPMLVAAGLAAVNFLYAVVVLKEPPSHRPVAGGRVPIRVLASAQVRNLCATYFLFTFAVTQLETVFAYFMKDSFGYDVPQVAWILVLMALVMASIQGGAIRRLVTRFGERNLVIFGVTLMGVSFATMPWPRVVGVLLVPLLGSAVGRAVSQPSLLGLVSFQTTHTTRGAVMGVFQASASAARVVGPLAAGALYDWKHSAPFLLASLLMIVALGTTNALGMRREALDEGKPV